MLRINNIEFFDKNELCEGGFVLQWSDADLGFGEITIYKQNDGYFIDTEYMSDEFVAKVFDEMLNMFNIHRKICGD